MNYLISNCTEGSLDCHILSLCVLCWSDKPHRWCNCYHAYLKCGRSRDGIWSGQTKDYKIGICFFSAKHAAIRAKTGWLVIRIMCQSMSTLQRIMCQSEAICLPCRLLFQWTNTIKSNHLLGSLQFFWHILKV